MPYVGNDLVDLNCPENRKKGRDSRYQEKILTGPEIDSVRSASDADAALWVFWACKEAADKVLCKQTPGAAFVPRRWFVEHPEALATLSPGESAVSRIRISDQHSLCVNLLRFSDHIHCVAVDAPEGLSRARYEVAPIPTAGTDPSVFIRRRLIARLAAEWNLAQADFAIVREPKSGELGPPRLFCDGVWSGLDISLSHDGLFAAYAYLGCEDSKPKG